VFEMDETLHQLFKPFEKNELTNDNHDGVKSAQNDNSTTAECMPTHMHMISDDSAPYSSKVSD